MPPAAATILHADLDAFYASVEQLLDPGLRGKPLAVGGGVVLAASYEARAYGVRGAMPAWRARRFCPELLFVEGHFDEYRRLSERVMGVLGDFTPHVERVSIDEAFLDVAGSRRLFGSPGEIGAAIRRRVREEVGLALSVGVARTKHLAKIASQVAKPDGIRVVEPESEQEFLDPLPVSLVWGVGPATGERLARIGVRTIGELRAVPDEVLGSLVGGAGAARLSQLAVNVDPRPVRETRAPASMGAQAALGRERATPRLVRTTLGYLSDRVAARLRKAGKAARTVTVRVRFRDLRSVTRARTVDGCLSTALDITDVAVRLAEDVLDRHPAAIEITLLAVSVSNLVEQPLDQLALPIAEDHTAVGGAPRLAAERSVDVVRRRFGREAVGYAGVVLSGSRRVPEAYRELAERSSEAPAGEEGSTRSRGSSQSSADQRRSRIPRT